MPDKSLDPPLYHRRKPLELGRIDAAVKIVVVGVYALGLCQLTTPFAALLSCGFSALLLLYSLPVPHSFWRRLCVINIFFIFLCLTLPIQFEADDYTVAQFGLVYISKEAFGTALVMLLKGNAIGSCVLLCIGSSSLDDNMRALLRLHIPQKFVTLILLTYANIQLLQKESAKLFLSAELRGFSPQMRPRAWKTYAWLFGMVFIRAWQRSERVNSAMMLRGFTGVFPLLHTPQVPPAGRKLWMIAMAGVLLCVSVLWWVESFSCPLQAFL